MNVNLFLNELGPFKKHHLKTFDFPNTAYLDDIHQLLNIWFNNYYSSLEDIVTSTKWIIDKFISALALSHFKNWLTAATTLAPQRIIPYSKYYKFVEMPFLAFIFPSTLNVTDVS